MKRINLFFLVLGIFMLSSCSMFSSILPSGSPTPDLEKTVHWMVDDAVVSLATQLVYEMRIEMQTMVPPTGTPAPAAAATLTSTPAPTVTSIWQGIHSASDSAASTELPVDCINRAKFVEDISVPDGTNVVAGKPFTKTWKLKNVGTCVWSDKYRFEFVDGEQMSENIQVPFPEGRFVYPDGEIELSVYMTAPEKAGVYQGNWMLRSPDGMLFGTGDNSEKPVWVKIEVK